jgi:hypothetical protein
MSGLPNKNDKRLSEMCKSAAELTDTLREETYELRRLLKESKNTLDRRTTRVIKSRLSSNAALMNDYKGLLSVAAKNHTRRSKSRFL